MLITRSPLRITLGGGGTDLASYYSKFGGFLIAAAIDRYVYITTSKPFNPTIILKYSKIEKVNDVEDIKHSIIRESIKLVNRNINCLELSSLADIPAGTGLGSSGSFTTALLKNLHSRENNLISQQELAEQACLIEIEKLGEPIGKQDQYIAAYGGITCFEFCKSGEVKVSPLKISKETLYDLEDNLLLFFTGYSRAASTILKEQNDKSVINNGDMIANLHFTKELGLKSKAALENGDLHKFGELMNIHWEYKKKRSGNMSNPKIDEWYNLALKNGAVGGKLIGAGGGGFLMFYAEDKTKLRYTLMKEGLEEVRFRFDFEGTKVIL
ncbi:galactokinase [Candidatus Nomurabacteria bacterium RIFCSPLOWO2_01_FULL_42_17]|uniref:Galactokinase n=1 Tax=Candidatus Nomurabacteria bacterium RIFCSPLOWO2_01_FULL_42_17 TaxID=1801780 RepID=A0A1F6XNQ8_9BACT|nr:MAG: galactokinase [Candidatus Nomurabacteria bacterium RIFCSPLOWO2_01_FULL_42_17]